MTRPGSHSSYVAVVTLEGYAGADEPFLQRGGCSEVVASSLFSRSHTSGGFLGCQMISNTKFQRNLAYSRNSVHDKKERN